MTEIKMLMAILGLIDPITIAIIFFGLISLGLIQLASIAIGNKTKGPKR